MEYYCKQDDFCTYSVPSRKGWNQSIFADLAEYRANIGNLAADYNEIVLQDGSGLLGSACEAGENKDCKAILYRITGRRGATTLTCPLGTEMVVTMGGNGIRK